MCRDPKFALAFGRLGEAYLVKYKSDQNLRWIDQASASCQRAIELNDQLAPVYVTLGRIHDSTGKQDLAVQEFQHALDLDTRSPDALGGMAVGYEKPDRYKEAVGYIRRALALRTGEWK